MTSKAEALLDALVAARADVKGAETEVHRAEAEMTAVAQAIEGDALASAYQTLRSGLHSGDTSAVADFNRRLREHFDAFVIDLDGLPVPIWKVEVPRRYEGGGLLLLG